MRTLSKSFFILYGITFILFMLFICLNTEAQALNNSPKVLTLEQRVYALEQEVKRLNNIISKGYNNAPVMVPSKGTTIVVPKVSSYNSGLSRPLNIKANTEYTNRSYRQIHHPEQVSRDNYERLHK